MGERTMRAVAVRGGRGTADDLHLAELPLPTPGPGQILIRVAAAGVNRPDLLQRAGLYPPPPGAPETLGLEVAGEVAAVGEGAARWREGDRVTALLGGGGYAEYAVADARHALPVPDGLDAVRAAGLPETVFTVWANVFEAARLEPGETLLVHGATSGIGATAIAMAGAHDARVIGTSRGADKARQAEALGADLSLDSSTGDWAQAVRDSGGADVILDMVGGAFTAEGIGCLKPGGRLVLIAFQAGASAELDLRRIMTHRLTVTGSTLRPRHADEKARLAAEIERVVWPWIASGRVRIPVWTTLPLERAGDAHRLLEEGRHVGKVVLVP